MCRMAAIKSRYPVSPSIALKMMLAMQKGHDNSGFAMVMQDLWGAFADFKEFPLLSMACTQEGLDRAEEFLENEGFSLKHSWEPDMRTAEKLDFQRMPFYIFRNYRFPMEYRKRSWEEKKRLLVETRLKLRELLSPDGQGYVYSFWPDVLTLKEVGDPRDIGAFFYLEREVHSLRARVISVQCRQNTNYQIVRYAAHPFFLEGYTLMGNGENTFYQKNKEYLLGRYPGYIGFESDTQCFLYTLHYVCEILGWPLPYYKHVITPLTFDEMAERRDASVLQRIRQSCQHLEINGPNTVIFVLPDSQMGVVCDAKKLRPVVIGKQDDIVVVASEVCGVNMALPDRDHEKDIYPGERETVVINNELEVQRWKQ